MDHRHREVEAGGEAAAGVDVGIIDPRGPRYSRMLVPAAAAAAIALGVTLGSGWALLGGIGAMLVAPMLTGRRRPRRARLVLGAGFVGVVGAGLLRQRIVGRRLKGASTARLDAGIGLLLDDGERPIVLEVRSAEAAADILAALGVGHGGFGSIDIDILSDRAAVAANALRRLALVPLVVTVAALAVASREDFFWFAVVSGVVVSLFAFCLSAVLRKASPRSRLRFEPGGLRVWGTAHPSFSTSYEAIGSVANTRLGVRLGLRDGLEVLIRMPSSKRGLLGGLTDEQRDQVTAQLSSAVVRAHGHGAPPPDVSENVNVLHRGGDTLQAWLHRLDSTASAMRAEGAYRAMPITRRDLWTALESSDADADARAGAARIIARLEGATARSRIEEIAAAARDELTERRIRIVLEPDPETAGRELEALEAEAARRAPPRLRA